LILFCYFERENLAVNDENDDHENYFSETYYLYQIWIGKCVFIKGNLYITKGIKKILIYQKKVNMFKIISWSKKLIHLKIIKLQVINFLTLLFNF